MPRVYPSAKDRILDAAERVILRDGPTHLSVDAVLREAALSKGGFFHHFESKQALLGALTERLAGTVAEQVARTVQRDRNAHARSLRAQITHAFDMPLAERERTRALVLALLSSIMEAPAVADKARAANEAAVGLAVAEGVDVGVALLVQFALDGFFLAESFGSAALDARRRAAVREALLALVSKPRKRARKPAAKGARRGV